MKEKAHFISSLEKLYEQQELQTMWRILWEDKLATEGCESLDEIIKALTDFVPIQYITGVQYFYDQKFIVNEHVLIPRSETEELVFWILSDENKDQKTVLDLGTGSGCIPIILKSKRNEWEVYGMDISQSALDVARKNGTELDIEVNWLQGDMLVSRHLEVEADIIVCNPPYVLTTDQDLMSKSTKLYEPNLALYVEENDPLKYYRAVIKNTIDSRVSIYYFEIHHLLADEMKELCNSFGLINVEIRKDMQGNDRMLRAENC